MKKIKTDALEEIDEIGKITKKELEDIYKTNYKPFKLCYISNGVMYFTDDFKNVHSDDWDDKPYEHNAEPPYPMSDRYSEEENRRFGNTVLRYLAFMKNWETKEPCDGHLNSPYSVEDINSGAIAWLYNPKAGGLIAGATIEEAVEWCKKANIKCGELK